MLSHRHAATLLLSLVLAPTLLAAGQLGATTAAAEAGVQGMPAGTTDTAFGPLTPADREFLIKVRQAGLWEGPAGQMDQFRSANPFVRDAGIHLVSGHAELDAKVLSIGAALGVTLSTTASAAQKGWIDEMRDAPTPAEFDRVFADRLRAAHRHRRHRCRCLGWSYVAQPEPRQGRQRQIGRRERDVVRRSIRITTVRCATGQQKPLPVVRLDSRQTAGRRTLATESGRSARGPLRRLLITCAEQSNSRWRNPSRGRTARTHRRR